MAYLITVLITILLDQVTKIAIIANLKPGESIPVMGNFFALTYVTNKGGAFGLFSGHPWFFVALAGLMVLAGIAFIPKIWKLPGILKFSLGLLVGGAIGNLIDRLRFGFVVDFLDFRIWPTFNVADIAICVGVGLLVIQLLSIKDMGENEEEKESEEPAALQENGKLKEQGTV